MQRMTRDGHKSGDSSNSVQKRPRKPIQRAYRSPQYAWDALPSIRHRPRDPHTRYQLWIARNMISSEEFYHQRLHSRELSYKPIISVLTPVFDTPLDVLNQAISSVRNQSYPYWELCLVNDGSRQSSIAELLDAVAITDDRIRVNHRPHNGGIVAASNDALRMAAGEFIALLDHDDLIEPDALYAIVRLLNDYTDADMIYSDEDRISLEGVRSHPYFKPDWSPEFFLSCMYTCHFSAYRRRIVEEVGGFREGFDGSQDYDLVLRVMERTKNIFHIPQVLYHWRSSPQSTASSADAKPYAYNAAKQAIDDYLERNRLGGQCEHGPYIGAYHVRFDITGRPLVSIIISDTGSGNGVEPRSKWLIPYLNGLAKKAGYDNYEFVVVDINGVSQNNLAELVCAGCAPVRLVPVEAAATRWGQLNQAANQAQGQYLLFLDEDLEPLSEGWLSSMLQLAQQDEIGAVGAKIQFADETIEHAGVVVHKGVPLRMFYKERANQVGLYGKLVLTVNYSAVSGSCIVTRRELFEKVGGFLDVFSSEYGTYDYCLRVRELGYRIVFTPFAEFRRCAEYTDIDTFRSEELSLFMQIWQEFGSIDPYFNPNLLEL